MLRYLATDFGDAEVAKKDSAICIQENVLRLQVTVHNIDRMQILLQEDGWC